MKLFINISLCLVAFSQLCSASIDDSKDKRFPVFNFISTKINEYFSKELLLSSSYQINIWTEYNEILASRNQPELFKSEDYQKTAKAVTQINEAVKKLEEDKGNCDLRNVLSEKLQDLTIPEYIDNAMDIIFLIPRGRAKLLRATLDEIDEQLPALITNFIEALDEREKEKYKDLVEYGKEYLAAKDKAEKVYFFEKILHFYPSDLEFKEAHCTWNASNYKIFTTHLGAANNRIISNIYKN